MWKWIKRSVLVLAGLGISGFVLLGPEVSSYVWSSGKAMRQAVKDSIPVEFDLKRARDLLEDLVPEMHANLKLVAREEVEVAVLEKELEREHKAFAEEEAKIARLRGKLDESHASFVIGSRNIRRADLVDSLHRRFERLRSSEVLLKSKEKLLENRRAALQAALRKLEKMRVTRLELASQIESLEGQYRLVQAEASTSDFSLDNSKIAQTHRLLADLRKRLEVAQRVLAHEARFVDDLPEETSVDEEEVLEEIDAHFEAKKGDLDTSL